MVARLPAFVPRIAVIALVALLATAGLTYAAEQTLVSTPAPTAAPAPVQARAVLVVPDLRRQAFVFAKGALQDAGFAWRVVGGAKGFAANVVVSQSPAPGTRVFDTGAPLVKLTLVRNSKYTQGGLPEDSSPYRATAVQLASAASLAVPEAAPAPTTTAPAATTPAPATTTPAAPATAAKPKQAAASSKPAAKPAAPKTAYPQIRPVAFAVAGAPKEPLDEMPLPDRATALGHWLAAHPKPTDAAVRYWLYQNAWVVTGAKFGWWRGAEALRILIAVDRKAESGWGIGTKSQAAAVQALSAVEAKAR
jgi:hypothetical protein